MTNEGPGVWQFVDGGERYFVDEWEEGDFGAFDEERSVGILEAAPEDESPPDDEPLPVDPGVAQTRAATPGSTSPRQRW